MFLLARDLPSRPGRRWEILWKTRNSRMLDCHWRRMQEGNWTVSIYKKINPSVGNRLRSEEHQNLYETIGVSWFILVFVGVSWHSMENGAVSRPATQHKTSFSCVWTAEASNGGPDKWLYVTMQSLVLILSSLPSTILQYAALPKGIRNCTSLLVKSCLTLYYLSLSVA